MESMARSISTHSLRMALGSRGADCGLTRLCISTSPVLGDRESQIWEMGRRKGEGFFFGIMGRGFNGGFFYLP